MLTRSFIRRLLSVLLVLLGTALIFFAAEALHGVVLVVLGVYIEVIGIAMKHR